MGRIAHRGGDEGGLSRRLASSERLVFQESGAPQGVREVAQQGKDVVLSGQLHERRLEIELVVIAVEEGEERHERRRDDQDLVAVEQGVANQEPRPVGDGRGHEIESGPER